MANKEGAMIAAEKIRAAALTANKGLSRFQAERAANAAARNVNAYGQKEEGPSRWQERKEAKRMMYMESTEQAAKLGIRLDKVGHTEAGNQQCQKCYKLGHWTYECKNERVYVMRPTRTQQLNNPKLRPRLEMRDMPPPMDARAEQREALRQAEMKQLAKKEEKKKKKEKEKSRKSSKRKRRASPSSSDSDSDSDETSSSETSSSGSESDRSEATSGDSSSSGSESSDSGSESEGSDSEVDRRRRKPSGGRNGRREHARGSKPQVSNGSRKMAAGSGKQKGRHDSSRNEKHNISDNGSSDLSKSISESGSETEPESESESEEQQQRRKRKTKK
eukprot:jgi/Mesen1/3525/ME000197S02545